MLKDLNFFKDKEDELLDKNPIIKQQYLQWFKDKIGVSRDNKYTELKEKIDKVCGKPSIRVDNFPLLIKATDCNNIWNEIQEFFAIKLSIFMG